MFNYIKAAGVDQLMALMQAFKADPRALKVDLVVGVYKDDAGNIPILETVKTAEARLVEGEETKNYVGVMGDLELSKIVLDLLLGEGSDLVTTGRARALQTPGGSGALKAASDFLNALRPGNTFWVSTPTWANHIPIAQGAGLTIAEYPYFRASDRALDFDAMLAHLEAHAIEGDALLLHACCHNPTGVDLSLEHWHALTELVVRKRLMPFVDCAYQGFGQGLEEDVAGLRFMAERVPEMLIASSFSKNFGIYRERAGALTLIAETDEAATNAMKAIAGLVRANYSMPPSHGARIVTSIFHDPELQKKWLWELDEMRGRIAGNRLALREALEQRQVAADVSFLTDQVGMFSYTGFSPEQVATLRDEFGIFTAGDGRINIAGLSSGNIDAVADGFAKVLR